MTSSFESRKGAEIKIIAGKYVKAATKAEKAWIDRENEPSDYFVPVILLLCNGKEKATKVRKTSYMLLTEIHTATNYEEQVFLEHDDINDMLSKL